MTKKERIKQLEEEVRSLRADVNLLRMLVYSRPVQDPVPNPWQPYGPVWTSDGTYPLIDVRFETTTSGTPQ